MSRRYDDSLLGLLFGIGLMLAWIGFCLALVTLKLWLIGSLVTSTVKTVKGDCGQTYGVETVLSGNWFCPTKGE